VINTARIASRVAQGGHDVSADVIGDRYRRSLALLPSAIRRSTRAYVFDNSGKEHRLIAEYLDARLVKVADDLPQWFVDAVLKKPWSVRRRP
jgi:predicted ABC-type ATPase